MDKTPKNHNTAQAARGRRLTDAEAAKRLAEYGENIIREERIHPLQKFLSYFWGPIPWMIEVAAVLSGAAQRWEDFTVIASLLFINAGVGFWEEYKADNAIEALKQHLAPVARLLRDSVWRDIPARELVAGDLVFLRLGAIVPADVELVDGDYLSIDQSALTGESLPVDKRVGDSAYSGSVVRQGEMLGVVTATGMDTYFGHTAHLVETAETRSHFQQAVLRIGNFLILTTLGLVVVVILVALFRGDPFINTLLFALILTVASIPVALPAVMSVTLAVGASSLARMQAIVSRLVAIEELAGMDVLCSDKTGTLTRNTLTVGDPVLISTETAKEVLIAAVLASEHESPDAIDAAVLKALPDMQALADNKILAFRPFDPVRKRAEAEVRQGERQFKIAKGAPQVIADLVEADGDIAERIRNATDELAARGYRTLGIARTDDDGRSRVLGLLPLFDPPREDSAETIRVLSVAVVAGSMGVFASFVLFWIARDYLQLPPAQIQTVIFLKLLVAGHLTIYITRSERWFWQRPWPAARLFWTTEAKQLAGTLAAVYGWLLEPIGWTYALLVWAYALVWFPINNAARVWVLDLWEHGLNTHARHLQRVHTSLKSCQCPPASSTCPEPSEGSSAARISGVKT